MVPICSSTTRGARSRSWRPARPARAIGEPGMYESLSLSPDGRHVMAVRLARPFSYIASYTGFPRVTEVLEVESGEVLATLEARELREGSGGGGPDNDPRDRAWRPDGSGISYLQRAEAEEGEDEETEDDRPDRIMLLRAPFGDGDAEVVATSDDRISAVTYSADGGHAFAAVRRDGEAALMHYALGDGDAEGSVLVPFHDPGDAVELPGDLLTARTGNGIEYAWMSSGGESAYLRGDGLKEDFRPQPFVDRLSIADGAIERLFEGSRDSFDQPLVPLDADLERMIVSREGKNTFPDSYMWTRDGGMDNLTRNVDPFPQLTAARRIDFEFTRRDGLEIQGRVSLPIDYVEGTRVPAIFWNLSARVPERGRLRQRDDPRPQSQRVHEPDVAALVRHLADPGVRAGLSGHPDRGGELQRLLHREHGRRDVRRDPRRQRPRRGRHGSDRARGPQLRRLRDRELPRAHPLLQGGDRGGRRLQPVAHADGVPGRAARHLGGAARVHGDVPVFQGGPDQHRRSSCTTGRMTTTRARIPYSRGE